MSEVRYEPLGVGAGTLIAGRYEIVRKLGSGAMSAVYEAIDKSLDGERVALKLFEPRLSREEQFVERFKSEVVITRKLTHENIVIGLRFSFFFSTSWSMTILPRRDNKYSALKE